VIVPRTAEMPSWVQQAESHQPHWPSAGGGRSASITVVESPSITEAGVTVSGALSLASSTMIPSFTPAGFE
jgi:hypothetical protein